MAIAGLDHVNIVATDLAATAGFYCGLLGLVRDDVEWLFLPGAGCWLRDPKGQAVLHLQAYDPARHGALVPREHTGAIDHIAFVCDDFDATLRHCTEAGLAPRVNEVPNMDFRQIFVSDPNNIMVELNFPGG